MKLRGGFTLVETGKRSSKPSQERWLLIKHRDEHADSSWDIESPSFDGSVLTGRSLKEIEEGSPTKEYRRGQTHV
jgi:bifunctional non-homologous end joining protein LigD